MTANRIGEIASRIIVVTIDRDGAITSVVRARTVAGDFETVANERWPSISFRSKVTFVVHVNPGDSGTIEIRPTAVSSAGTRTIISLGVERPFLEGDLPVRTGANGAYTQCNSVKFCITADAVTWQAESMSGRSLFSDRSPALSVALRLPPDNHGAISFSSSAGCPLEGRLVCSSQGEPT
jgi:hypothetical protein